MSVHGVELFKIIKVSITSDVQIFYCQTHKGTAVGVTLR